jgi:phosphate butyryltransferase
MIRSLDQMVEKVNSLHKKHRIAVAWAHDINTINAIHKAVNYGLADALMIGQASEIRNICRKTGIDHELFTIIDSDDEIKASAEAVRLVRSGEADVAMKGLVGTDKFLKAIMDKTR